MKTIVVKLGGSVITKKDEDLMEVRKKPLKQLCTEISEALKHNNIRLVIVHGAGPYGHVPAKRYALDKGLKGKEQVHGCAITHQNMEELNAKVVSALINAGVDAVAFQPSAGGILKNKKLVSFPIDGLNKILDIDLVPVLYGDVLPDLETGINILSGDHLVPYLAKKLKADEVVIVTSYNGIYDKPPEEPDAKKIDVINSKNITQLTKRKTKGSDVTGGILRKAQELIEITKDGIPSEIIGAEKGYLLRALKGEKGIGTRIE